LDNYTRPCNWGAAILLLAASGVSNNKKQKIFPGLKLKSPEEGAQGVIGFLPPPGFLIRSLIEVASPPSAHRPACAFHNSRLIILRLCLHSGAFPVPDTTSPPGRTITAAVMRWY
jgi:hypothetical protein